MTHPCATHACDHCYLCDVVGVCCQTAPAAQAAHSTQGTLTDLRTGLAEDRVTGDGRPTLRTPISRSEDHPVEQVAIAPPFPLGLSPGSPDHDLRDLIAQGATPIRLRVTRNQP